MRKKTRPSQQSAGESESAQKADGPAAPETRTPAQGLPVYPDPIDDTLDDTFPASDPPSWPGLSA